MWNYRVYKKLINSREYYYLKETYYDSNGQITSIVEDTMTGYFEDLDSLQQLHEHMLNDIKKYREDVLDESVFEFAGDKL